MATCDGYLGLFGARSATEQVTLATGGRDRNANYVAIETRDGRALVARGSPTRTTLELVSPQAATPVLWSYANGIVGWGLGPDGRVGWVEAKYSVEGVDYASFTMTPGADPMPAAGVFLGWAGDNIVSSEDGNVTLRVGGRPVFSHDAACAPWANTVSSPGHFWASGFAPTVRFAPNDPTPLVFDVFGTQAAPVVARVPPQPAPPPVLQKDPTPDRSPDLDETTQGNEGRGP